MSHDRTMVHTPLESIFHWEYDVKFPQMDRLYENAKRDQWNVSTTLNWDRPIDNEVLDMSMMPIFQTELYKSQSDEVKTMLPRKAAAWRLSQFLHGEQGALMVCGQLVDAVPDLDAKMNAAAQVFDEARHVEGFRKYITKLDRIYPIDPGLEKLLKAVLEHDRWEPKYVGMQIIAEGLAIAAFRFMHRETKDPLLRELLEYIMKDESRHVGFGMLALRDAVKNLKGKDKKDLEEFAFTASDMMVTKFVDGKPKDGFLSFDDVLHNEIGISAADIEAELNRNKTWRDAELGMMRQFNSFLFVDTIIPCLRQLDLINERTEPWYRQLGVMEMAAPA
ncbi:MAG TPA: ferritin-like domain-containing protein [Candidatus Binataceae bacterium]|nr:ferritin-like domain-containing protein [Candidatus Binataceae bacterium]